jgi:hypothetical protein
MMARKRVRELRSCVLVSGCGFVTMLVRNRLKIGSACGTTVV